MLRGELGGVLAAAIVDDYVITIFASAMAALRPMPVAEPVTRATGFSFMTALLVAEKSKQRQRDETAEH